MSEARPIDLCLLACQLAEAQIGLGHRSWSQRGDQVAEVIAATDMRASAIASRRAAVSVGYLTSVCVINGRNGSMPIGQSGVAGAGAGTPLWASTRHTVSRCRCNWRAMVPRASVRLRPDAGSARPSSAEWSSAPHGLWSGARSGQRTAGPWRSKPGRTHGCTQPQRRQRQKAGSVGAIGSGVHAAS